MKKMNATEMSETYAAGCGWIKRMAKRAAAGGDSASALLYINAWADCKMQ